MAPKKDTPLNEYLQMGLEKHLEDLNAISSQASKEYAVEKALEKMKKQWESMEFAFTSYKDTGIPILNSIDDIQVLLDDHIVKSATMKGSPFIGPFEDEIMQWDVTLVRSIMSSRDGFTEGAGDASHSQGFEPMPTQKVPPLVLVKKSIFGRPTVKLF